MVKKIKKVGNGNALFLDKPLLELVGLEEGAEVHLTVEAGSIIVTPVRPSTVPADRFEAALKNVISKRRRVLKRLAE
jgi:antitoxin component of MazEF toxin-antitoxin module